MSITQAKTLVTLISVVLFVGTILSIAFAPRVKALARIAAPTQKISGWWWGFLLAFLMVAAVSYITNPRGYFPPRIYPMRFQTTPPVKIEMYRSLPYDPDVVVVGSSRAHSLTAEIIEDQTGLSFFNGSNSNSSTGETLLYLKVMADSPSTEFPEVLLVETPPAGNQPNFNVNSPLWPLFTIPYMPLEEAIYTVTYRAQSLVSLEHLAEGMYVAAHTPPAENATPADVRTNPDGSMLYDKHTDAELTEMITTHIESERAKSAANTDPAPPCDQVGEHYAAFINDVIALADQNDAAVIFYISPLHPQYYDYVISNPTADECLAVHDRYLTEIDRTHDGVYFLNYLDPSTLDLDTSAEGFENQDHIMLPNVEVLIAAAADTIEDAYQYASDR